MNTLLGQSEVQEELVEWVNAIAKHSSSEARKTGRAEYEEWITGAVKKGMRPLFRAVKAHEQCFDRPFRDHDPKSRPFLRLKQWMPIWKAGPSPAEACIARVKDRAICERATLAPLSSDEVGTRLRRCPLRAPGPDGWTPAMARSLPPEAVEELTAILNLIEEKGEAPAQWRIVKVVMLVKNEVVERPIGLCHIVYKIWMQARYGLIQAWLSEYTKTATWDAAQPGVACLSIAVQRVLQAEIAKCSKRPRISLFLDLSTFFETVDHHKLAHMAEILAFPATVLNVALQVYRGGRVICSEGQTSPPAFPTRGIVAGCPAAPVLSKVALHLPCSRASDSGLADNIDVWIDDISADFEGRNPAEVAWKAVKLYRQLRADLGSESLLLSEKKSAFICTDKTVAKSLQQLLKPGEPKIENLVKDLGVDSAGARRRRVKQSNTRLRKAGLRSQKLRQLRVPDKKCLHRASRASIFTAGTWGHQAAGLSPKRMKSVRAAAGTHAGRLGYGSLDVVYDLGENGVTDPMKRIILEHWSTLAHCVKADKPAAQKLLTAWEVMWKRGSNSPHPWRIAVEPLGAMQCYLRDMGYDAPTFSSWRRPTGSIVIPWGSPTAGLEVKDQLDAAIDQDRWQRIAAQEGGTGAEQGLDWSAARKLLKKHSKNHLLRSGLRMLWQGAIKRASHGGPDACEVCGEPNTLRHALQECPAWASHDIGPDPAWRVSLPQAPRCLWERGLVPKQLTVHPALPAELLAVQKTGFFLQPDPCKEVYFGTDATGGPKGNDPRLRLVSWAVVAIQALGGDLPTDPAGELFPKTRFKVVGTMKGALQIGATVNDGECVALDQLACFVGQTASVAVDSKVAAKRCQNPIAERIWPQIWESQASQRARLQVTWTKGHLNEEQHAKRFGVSCNWAWAANLLADDICGKLSACLFSQEQAALTDTCDKVATAVSTWLGKRCAHLLATAKPTKGPKDHPFQELPNKSPSPPKAVGPN